jgi:hypothetical protein
MFTKRTAECVLVTVVVLVLGSSAFAADIYVDAANCPGPGTGTIGDPYCTIQDALDLPPAVAGDVIKVAAGTYDENVDVNVAVSIEGAGSGTTAADTIIDPTAGRGLYIHDSVNLSDLRVTGATVEGIRVEKSGGLAFDNVTWSNIASSANAGRGAEFHNLTAITNMTIMDSEFVDNGDQGIRTASNVTVNGMAITNSVFDRNSYGVYLQGTLNDVSITGSTMNDSTGGHGRYASETGPVTNLTITDCVMTGNLRFGAVLYTAAAAGFVGTTISETRMDNNTESGFWIGADVITDFLMECGSVSGNAEVGGADDGIKFSYGVLTNVVVNDVNIAGNINTGAGLTNTATGTVTATGNWWGDASGPSGVGPGTGDAVTAGVTYDPWLVAPSTCLVPSVPTMLKWGMATVVLLLLMALTVKLGLMGYRRA